MTSLGIGTSVHDVLEIIFFVTKSKNLTDPSSFPTEYSEMAPVVTEFHSYYSLPIFTVGSGVSGPSGIVSPALAIELRPDQAPCLVCNSRLVMHDSYTCSASLAIVALLLLLLYCCCVVVVHLY